MLQEWDVALVSGNGSTLPELNAQHRHSQRKIFSKASVLFVGGTKMRLGGRSDLAVCMPEEDRQYLSEFKVTNGKEPAASVYRSRMNRPLMLLYFLEPKNHETTVSPHEPMQPYEREPNALPLVGVHLSFPKGEGAVENRETVTFIVNTVWQKFNNAITEFDITDADADDLEGFEE